MTKKDIPHEAMTLLGDAQSYERRQRQDAADDVTFAQQEGGQWDEYGRNQRKNRPKYEINKIAPLISRMYGKYKKHSISIKVRGANSDATADLAETYNGIIRNINKTGLAQDAYDTAMYNILNSGYGAWRIKTDYDGDGFDIIPKIEPITSPLTQVWSDPAARLPCKQDAKWKIVEEAMTPEQFKEKWPKAQVSNVDSPVIFRSPHINQDFVTVAEYWQLMDTTRTKVKMSDGSIHWLDEIEDVLPEMELTGVKVVKERNVSTTKVVMHIVNAVEVLSGPHEFPGDIIPIIQVYGENHYEKDNFFYRGAVRLAKDAQRLYNWTATAQVENVAASPIDPYWMSAKQAEGYTDKLQRMAIDNFPVQFYNPDPENPGPPRRSGTTPFNQALVQIQQQSSTDIESTMNSIMTPEALPDIGQEILLSTKESMDEGLQLYMSSITRGVQVTAEILVNVIPAIYDFETQVRVMGADGETDFVPVNTTVVDEFGNETIINDLSKAKFDVVSDAGPAVATQRIESANAILKLIQAYPELAPLVMDEAVGNLDIDGVSELKKRIRRKQIQDGTVIPTEEEAEEFAPTEAELQAQQQQAQQQQEMTALQMDQLRIQNETMQAISVREQASAVKAIGDNQKSLAEIEDSSAERIETRIDSQVKINNMVADKVAAGIPVLPGELEALAQNTDLLNVEMQENTEEKIEEQIEKTEERMRQVNQDFDNQ